MLFAQSMVCRLQSIVGDQTPESNRQDARVPRVIQQYDWHLHDINSGVARHPTACPDGFMSQRFGSAVVSIIPSNNLAGHTTTIRVSIEACFV